MPHCTQHSMVQHSAAALTNALQQGDGPAHAAHERHKQLVVHCRWREGGADGPGWLALRLQRHGGSWRRHWLLACSRWGGAQHRTAKRQQAGEDSEASAAAKQFQKRCSSKRRCKASPDKRSCRANSKVQPGSRGMMMTMPSVLTMLHAGQGR